jgi:hypothetical protein
MMCLHIFLHQILCWIPVDPDQEMSVVAKTWSQNLPPQPKNRWNLSKRAPFSGGQPLNQLNARIGGTISCSLALLERCCCCLTLFPYLYIHVFTQTDSYFDKACLPRSALFVAISAMHINYPLIGIPLKYSDSQFPVFST